MLWSMGKAALECQLGHSFGNYTSTLYCRSTGEFPSMTLAERKHAAELCRAHWPGTVVVGVSSTAVADCVELLEHASTKVTTANKVSTVLSHQ